MRWRRSPMRFVVIGSLALLGCNALIGVKDIYLDEGVAGDGGTEVGVGFDASLDGNVATEGGIDAGPCVDLMTNPNHCGACGHSCGGGSCADGRCKPVVLAAGIGEPKSIAIDATHVFFPAERTGVIARVPKVGGAVDTLAADQTGARAVAVDGDTLFWANRDFAGDGGGSGNYVGGIWKCGIATCATSRSLVAVGGYAVSVAVKDGVVYFAQENEQVFSRVRTDGTDLRDFPGPYQFPFGIAVDGAWAYMTSRSFSFLRQPIDGGPRDTLGSGPAYLVGLTAIAGDRVFWTFADEDGTGHVRSVLRANPGSSTLVDYGTANKFSLGVFADSTDVYWTNEGTEDAGISARDGELLSCPVAGCPPAGPTVIASALELPGALTADDRFLYFVEIGSFGASTGRVSKVAKPAKK